MTGFGVARLFVTAQPLRPVKATAIKSQQCVQKTLLPAVKDDEPKQALLRLTLCTGNFQAGDNASHCCQSLKKIFFRQKLPQF